MNGKASTRTTCSGCHEPIFPDDTFCAGCGLAVAEMASGGASAPSNPSGPLLGRAETRALTGVLTQYAESEQPCLGCGRTMGPEERFCAGCGKLRAGLDASKTIRGESRTEQAWREIRDKLQAATAGRYEIVRELGRGGMAAVYLANEISLKRQVAIKVMRPSLLLDEGMVERFNREARTMAALHHPNIVAIHAVEEADDLHFFVMQYIPGRALDQVVRESGPQPVAAVQSVIYQAGAALTHAHKQGVIHRDIKPANIMLDLDGNAIVTDFGIAKVTDVQVTSATSGALGTPLYMSPEQCSGAALTPASDQYALGNVAYELLTGHPPFERPSTMALGMAILTETPQPLRQFRSDVPAEIEAAVLMMLAKKPEQRFPTLSEASAAIGGEILADDDPIREYLRAVAKKEGRADGRRLTPKSSRSGVLGRGRFTGLAGFRIRRMIVAGLVVLAAAASALYFLRPGPDPVSPPTPVPPAPTPAVVPPAVPPAPAPTDPTVPVSAAARAEAATLVTAGRRALGRADWARAVGDLARASRLDPANADARRFLTEATRRRDSAARVTPGPVPPVPGPRPESTASVTPAPAPAPAPSPPPAPPPPPSRPAHEAEIRQVVDGFVRGINARSVNQLKALFPGLGGQLEQDWRERFGREIKRVSATGVVRRIDESSDQAEVSFEVQLTLEPEGAAPLEFRLRYDGVLRNQGGGWKFVTLSERGG